MGIAVMLEAIELECIRGERRLFSGLSFSLGSGELLRVVGANGSGKTSLLRIMCGLVEPSAGALRWQGRSIRTEREEYSRNLVFIGHLNALKDDLTALENLQVAAALAGMPADAARMLAALDCFGVAHCAELPAKVLSQGQRRRAALARLALSSAVPLWILDEPFSALDVAAVVELERLLAAHLASGGMVVLTTHQEVQVVAQAVLRVDLDLHAAALLAA
jgi:heme exporter protein A